MEQISDQSTYKNKILSRFLGYVAIDSASDPRSEDSPSSQSQKELSRKLVMDLFDIGLQNVAVDSKGYITATLPSNSKHRVPTIGFIAHYDTTPDLPGIGSNYRIFKDYDGGELILDEEEGIVLSPADFPQLLHNEGETVITTDGHSVLGVDGKAGIAEIVTALEYLSKESDGKHGPIRIALVPDEHIGRGARHFDIDTFGAEWAYSLQSQGLGVLQYESFYGAEARITVNGKKPPSDFSEGEMINASRLAYEYLQLLPADEIPELTEDDQGFFHLSGISGDISKSLIHIQVRDHDKGQFEARKKLLGHFVESMNAEYPGAFEIETKDLYPNMVETIEPHKEKVELAVLSMVALGIKPRVKPIRSENLAVELSREGLPCTALFTGGLNFNTTREFISLGNMEKAMSVLIKIATATEKKFRGQG